MRSTFQALALLALLPLAGCGRDEPPSSPDGTPVEPANTALGRKIQQAMAEAGDKLAGENIRVGKGTGHPRAEITPQGDFLVAGKAVAVDDAQRKLLLAHREHLIAIARAGIAVGMRGADLGIEAAAGALKSAFSGKTGEFERQMEARGKQVEAEARKICERLPALLESQQALAASLPAFRPYANMDQGDIEDCGKDGHYDVDLDGDVDDTDAGTSAPARDAAAEADAAAAGFAAATPGGSVFTTRGVKFVLPGGRVEMSEENGVWSASAGGVDLRLEDRTLRVNGRSMPLPPSGSTVTIDADGQVEVH